MKNCDICLKPHTQDIVTCDFCDNTVFDQQHTPYTIKQWEWWRKSVEGAATHDFAPWEFDGETGHITRGPGMSGVAGTPIRLQEGDIYIVKTTQTDDVFKLKILEVTEQSLVWQNLDPNFNSRRILIDDFDNKFIIIENLTN